MQTVVHYLFSVVMEYCVLRTQPWERWLYSVTLLMSASPALGISKSSQPPKGVTPSRRTSLRPLPPRGESAEVCISVVLIAELCVLSTLIRSSIQCIRGSRSSPHTPMHPCHLAAFYESRITVAGHWTYSIRTLPYFHFCSVCMSRNVHNGFPVRLWWTSLHQNSLQTILWVPGILHTEQLFQRLSQVIESVREFSQLNDWPLNMEGYSARILARKLFRESSWETSCSTWMAQVAPTGHSSNLWLHI